jgi:hypothetical protein
LAEWAMDDDQRHSLSCPLGGVGVTELVWRERRRTQAATASCVRAPAVAQGRPPVAPLRTQNSGPTGSSSRHQS